MLAAAADALARLDPADLPDAAVADLAVATRRGIDRLEGCFVRLARAAHLRGLGSESGAPSTAAWLARRAVMRTGDARAAIEAGEVCDLLAATGDFGDLAAETVVTALHAYTDPPTDDDRRPGSQRRADALVRRPHRPSEPRLVVLAPPPPRPPTRMGPPPRR
ncbi:MAG: hypothetical protein IT197_02435 [Acidimicrobiia bacterium]|nr:hypothetical protein [Acidimicrobiia bacterium]